MRPRPLSRSLRPRIESLEGRALLSTLASFTLIDADTDQPIAGYEALADGATLNLATLPTRNLNIRANTSPAAVGSVKFAYDGNADYRTEDAAPYALAGDVDGDYAPWTPSLGTHALTATPYAGAGATGAAGQALTVRFTVVEAALAVASFTLIDADTDQPIAGYEALADGATLNLATLPTRNLSLRANTSPAAVGSVKFAYDGNADYRTEDAAPYALAGDVDGDYAPWTPSLGTHALTATPYAGAGATGAAGQALTVRFTVVPPPSPPVEPSLFDQALARWQSQMVQAGRAILDQFRAYPGASGLGLTFYDSTRVFYQIADYTNDPSWLDGVRMALDSYRDSYVLPNNGGVPGYWIFTQGLLMDYQRTGSAASLEAVLLLSTNAAFAGDSTPAAWTAGTDASREVAFNLSAQLDAEALGAPHRARTDLMADQALGHLDQWTVSRTAPYVRPFMVGLTCEALIAYHDKTGDARVLPAIRTALDWLWANCWIPEARAFKYTDIVDPYGTGGTEPAPDLNLLIAPAFAWVYHQTGIATYRDRGDAVFAGGVDQSWLGGSKQFNQNYSWSFDYVKWRTEAPLGG